MCWFGRSVLGERVLVNGWVQLSEFSRKRSSQGGLCLDHSVDHIVNLSKLMVFKDLGSSMLALSLASEIRIPWNLASEIQCLQFTEFSLNSRVENFESLPDIQVQIEL